jgi:hypothetical protein
MLRLTGIGGRLLLAFYGIATTLVALLNFDKYSVAPLLFLALGLMFAALAVLASESKEPFGALGTTTVIVLVAATTFVNAWNLANPASPGYANWHMGAMTFVLLVLALRGRPKQAWLGYGIFASIEILSTFYTDLTLIAAITDIARQAATLLIGSLFAMLLRRASRTITAIQETQLSRAAARAATAAATGERERQVARLERDARPALDRILSGVELTAEEREGFALLEAGLRDGIRAAGFSSEALAAETREARARGLQVVLLDDRGSELDDDERAVVELAVIDQLRASAEGTITARLSPYERDEIATIVVDEGGVYRRVVVRLDSVEVTHLS